MEAINFYRGTIQMPNTGITKGNAATTSKTFEGQLVNVQKQQLEPAPIPVSSKPVLLGSISKETPTVSNLLVNNSTFKKDTWKIIHADQNKNKPFRTIRDGTKIFINPETKELMWGKMIPKVNGAEIASGATKIGQHPVASTSDINLSEQLAKAVEGYMGTSYNKINCYGLLVRGLNKMGIQYGGKDGLRNQLVKMAKANNMPRNAFFNGEGLIKASGTSVYTKSFRNVRNTESAARKVMDDIKPLLKKGYILSFSTPTKGHTGIISKKDDTWTYINSGDLDNAINPLAKEKGVGEEKLMEELHNWMDLATERKESLAISLGKLKDSKVQAYLKEGAGISEKA